MADKDSSLPILKVEYPKVTLDARQSNVQDKKLFKEAPQVTFAEADSNMTYTLIMEDPDAPGHGAGEAWLHWIVTEIPGKDIAKGNLSKGLTVTDHNPPTPPKGSGVHRYYFYAYSEGAGSQSGPESVDNRRKFKIADYTSGRGLTGPIASNMFQTQF